MGGGEGGVGVLCTFLGVLNPYPSSGQLHFATLSSIDIKMPTHPRLAMFQKLYLHTIDQFLGKLQIPHTRPKFEI